MQLSLTRLTNNKIFRSILVITGGTAAAQLITLAVSPLITRIYTPDALGILGSFVAILTILLPLISLSYPIAMVLPKSDDESIKLGHISLFLAHVSLIVLLLGFILISSFSHSYFNQDLFQDYWLLFFLLAGLLANTILSVFQQWVIRKKLFKISAKSMLAHSVFVNTFKVSAGLILPVGKTLVLATVAGFLFQSAFLFFILKNTPNSVRKLLKLEFCKTTAKNYIEFAKYRSPQATLANVNQSIPVLLLAHFFGPSVVGLYVLCKSVLVLPIALIAKSVNDVLYPQITDAYHNKQSVYSLIIKSTLALSLVALFPLIILTLWGPALFSLVFGQNWTLSGEFAQWLSVWFFFNFINRPSVAAIPVLKLEKLLLYNSVLNFVISSLAFVLGYAFFNNAVGAIAMFSVAGVIPQLVIILSALRKARSIDYTDS